MITTLEYNAYVLMWNKLHCSVCRHVSGKCVSASRLHLLWPWRGGFLHQPGWGLFWGHFSLKEMSPRPQRVPNGFTALGTLGSEEWEFRNWHFCTHMGLRPFKKKCLRWPNKLCRFSQCTMLPERFPMGWPAATLWSWEASGHVSSLMPLLMGITPPSRSVVDTAIFGSTTELRIMKPPKPWKDPLWPWHRVLLNRFVWIFLDRHCNDHECV